jgi:hypothetical protein
MDVFDHPLELPFPEANLTARGAILGVGNWDKAGYNDTLWSTVP